MIQDKLRAMDVAPEDVVLGDFDWIGEFTAKKNRDKNSDLWKKAGAFFRPNYERGILIHYLIKQHNLRSFMEIGFGRGYAAVCAAKALHEMGITEPGAVTTIDPVFNEEHLRMIAQIFPPEWLNLIKFVKGTSQAALTQMPPDKFDLVYIDGDHRAEAVQIDWDLCKDRWNCFLLFDDYNPDTTDENIQCSKVIDTIDDPSKELIILDRRMFQDDRKVPDEDIKYGQVLLTNAEGIKIVTASRKEFEKKSELWEW